MLNRFNIEDLIRDYRDDSPLIWYVYSLSDNKAYTISANIQEVGKYVYMLSLYVFETRTNKPAVYIDKFLLSLGQIRQIKYMLGCVHRSGISTTITISNRQIGISTKGDIILYRKG